jgi:hypothetical protein
MVIAITILERRINVLSGALFDQIRKEKDFQFVQMDLDTISDSFYDVFK